MTHINSQNNRTIWRSIVLLLIASALLLSVRSAAQEPAQSSGVILIPAERTAPQAWRIMLEEVERAFGGEWESAEGYVAAATKTTVPDEGYTLATPLTGPPEVSKKMHLTLKGKSEK